MIEKPYITVVIPTCHRNDLLSLCLDALAPGMQTLPPDSYEVIVSDDGRYSTASEMIATRYPWALWFAGPQRGPAANRNSGANQGKGKWIAFIDDDCVPDPRWLEAFYAASKDDGAAGILEGRTFIPNKEDTPFLLGIENLEGGKFQSCNIAFRRDVFFRVGAFDEDFREPYAEDLELVWRMIEQNGVQAKFVAEALVAHPSRPVGLRKILSWTLIQKWMLLYYIKTQQAPPLSAGFTEVIWSLAVRTIKQLCDDTANFFAGHNRDVWRRRVCILIWRWLTLPAVLPYLLYWEFQFRRHLKNTTALSV